MIRIMPISIQPRKESTYTGLVVKTTEPGAGQRTRSSLGPHYHGQGQGQIQGQGAVARHQTTATAAAAGRKRPHSDTGIVGKKAEPVPMPVPVVLGDLAGTRNTRRGQRQDQVKVDHGLHKTARLGDKKAAIYDPTHNHIPNQFKTDCGFNIKLGQSRRLGSNDPYSPEMDVFPEAFFRFRRSRLVREDLKKQDYLSTLPDEMLLKVLKFLPTATLGKVAQVNKKFSSLVQDESLWSSVDCIGKILNGEHVDVLMKRKPVYLRLSRACISPCPTIPPTSQLSYLDLSMCITTPEMLNRLLRTCTNLQKLSLEHLEISPAVLETCLQFAHSLRTLNMAMCYGLDAAKLSSLLIRCQKLTEFNMGCVKQNWTRDELINIMSSFPTGLEQLNMAGCRESVNDTHIQLMATRCTHLFDLDISDSQTITMLSIEALSNLDSLQHLGMSRCYSVEPEAYTILATMKSLRYLELFSLFKESSVEKLARLLPRVSLNQFPFSAIARPTVGERRGTIWGKRV